MADATISARLAAHVIGTRFEDLPADAVTSAKRMALDTLAVAWAGASAPGIGPVREMMLEESGAAQSTVWATTAKLPARTAAFLNSAAAAALDYDGMRATERGSVHSDSVVLPAALAVAESQSSSGRDLVAALVLGNDVVSRLGAASALPHKGWYHTSIYGIFGAAAAAARLLKLDAEATMHAFGLAANHAGATQLPNIERSLAKRFSSSFAAHDGVLAALMAARGITAAKEAFEGRSGFYDLYQNGEPAILFDGIGKSYPHISTGIKRYPSCACNHTAIEAALELARRFEVTPGDIEALEVTISPYVNRLCGAEFDPGADPQVAAQFSVQYSVAAPMLRRRFGVADIDPASVLDAETVRLSKSVKVRVDESWANSRAATVVLTSRKHGRQEHHVEHIPGSAKAPLGEADVREKALDCFQAGPQPLTRDRAEALVQRVLALDTLDDAGALFARMHRG